MEEWSKRIWIHTEDLIRAGITYKVETKVSGDPNREDNVRSVVSASFLADGKSFKINCLELKPYAGHHLQGRIILDNIESMFNRGSIIRDTTLDAFLQLAIHKDVTLYVDDNSIIFNTEYEALEPIGRYIEQQKLLEKTRREFGNWIDENGVTLQDLAEGNENGFC